MAFRPIKLLQSAETAEINLTPLIDVSLVLVVMLLLATPLAFESSIGVKRGQDSGRKSKSETDAPRIEVTVLDAEHVSVNHLEVRLDRFGQILEPLLEDAPGAPVVVRCATGVTHGTFVTVLDEAKAHGATSIAVTKG